jgi:two-component system, NarL family, nitrate/nitrite response regulator NarL
LARVAIIDDHPFFRLGAEAALREAGHDIVASSGDSRAAIETIDKADPQIVLLDQRMTPVSGSSILNSLRQRGDERPVIVLTNELADDALLQIMRSRVNGIVFKHFPQESLLNAIEQVLAGGRAIDGKLFDKALALSSDSSGDNAVQSLTDREMAVAKLIAKGLRNRQIGEELGMTEGTVKVYLHNIYRKLGLANRTELALAIEAAANPN